MARSGASSKHEPAISPSFTQHVTSLPHQIIARIQTPSVNVRRLINALLIDIGKAHPQALIYPLTVASASSSTSRQAAASGMMERMREHSSVLVEQVRMPANILHSLSMS